MNVTWNRKTGARQTKRAYANRPQQYTRSLFGCTRNKAGVTHRSRRPSLNNRWFAERSREGREQVTFAGSSYIETGVCINRNSAPVTDLEDANIYFNVLQKDVRTIIVNYCATPHQTHSIRTLSLRAFLSDTCPSSAPEGPEEPTEHTSLDYRVRLLSVFVTNLRAA